MVIEAPNSIRKDVSFFLAGTIDNGESFDWQHVICDEYKDKDVIIYNPRRRNWDKDADGLETRKQIAWELDALENADHIILVLLGESRSPISLLELGLFARTKKLHVLLSNDFYRFDNVEMVCKRYGAQVVRFSSNENMLMLVRGIIDYHSRK